MTADSSGPANSAGAFVTSYRNYELEGVDLIQQHKQAYQDLSNGVNQREIALYDLTELVTGQQWFTLGDPQTKRYAYRTTFDLVDLNGGNIPDAMTTSITLTTSTIPPFINNALDPIHGFGGATGIDGIFYFVNDPELYVRFDNTTNTVIIVNNTGVDMTQMYWVMEYLKN